MSILLHRNSASAASQPPVKDVPADFPRAIAYYGNSGFLSTIRSYTGTYVVPGTRFLPSIVEKLKNFWASLETPLEKSISIGKEYLSLHFSNEHFYLCDPAHSVVLVIMKCNDRTTWLCRKFQVDLESLAFEKLKDFLSDNTEFEINTWLIQKNGNNSLNIYGQESLIFTREMVVGGPVEGADLKRCLEAIPDEVERQSISDFVNKL